MATSPATLLPATLLQTTLPRPPTRSPHHTTTTTTTQALTHTCPCPWLRPPLPAALDEAATLVNEGDLLVTALSLNFATTALREQAASAATVVDKVRTAGLCGRLRGLLQGRAAAGGPGACEWRRDLWCQLQCLLILHGSEAAAPAAAALWTRPPPHIWAQPVPLLDPVQVLPQAIALVKSPLLQGGARRVS